MTITIRALSTVDDLERAVDLQKVYWGEDMSDLVPQHMLLSIVRYGGHVHGAFDGDTMVGMLLGFLGSDFAAEDERDACQRLLVMSKRMVVLPGYRGQKIGERLKLAQADFARRHNIQLVTWTFDPLLSRNAYLNLRKLRGVVQKYTENYFGDTGDNPVMSADRLNVNLWVNHPRLIDPQPLPASQHAPSLFNTTLNAHGLRVPQSIMQADAPVVRLEIPIEFVPLERIDPKLGMLWRDTVRHAFQQMLQSGYIATDFVRVENRVFYVFTRDDHSYTFTG